jgi:molybdopterin adenylyltransferase
MKIAVITVSDRASAGIYEDKSGPEIVRLLAEALPAAEVATVLVPDEEPAIFAALRAHASADWIITTGGTGPSPRDVTPEATRTFIQRELPGIAQAIMQASLAETSSAAFSRAIAGQRGACLVVNLPGSPRAVRCGMGVLIPLLDHGAKMVRGEGH